MARPHYPNQITFRQGIDFILKLCFGKGEADLSSSFEQHLDFLLQCDNNNPHHQNNCDSRGHEEGLLACFSLCRRIEGPPVERLSLKTCQLTEKLIAKHHLKLSDGALNQLISYHLELCQRQFSLGTDLSSNAVYLDGILASLGSLLFENGSRISQTHKDALLGVSPSASSSSSSSSSNRSSTFSQLRLDRLDGLLPPLCSSSCPASTRLAALKCLRNLTIKSTARNVGGAGAGETTTPLNAFHATRCYDVFLHFVLSPTALPPVGGVIAPPPAPGAMDAIIAYAQRQLTAFQGIENCLLLNYDVHGENVGHLMAAIKSFMFFGITGSYSVPAGVDYSACLYPTPLSIPDAPLTMKEIGILPGKVAPSPNKKNRRRGKKNNKSRYAVATGDDGTGVGGGGGGGGEATAETSAGSGAEEKPSFKRGGSNTLNPNAPEFLPSGISVASGASASAIYRHPNFTASDSSAAHFFSQRQMKLAPSSDSEFSDTEGGTLAKLRNASSFLRQQCHATLYSVIKCTDRRIILGYWSALLPDRNVTSSVAAATLTSVAPSSNGEDDDDDDRKLSFSRRTSSSASFLESRNLLVAIMKDPSAKVRATAVAVVSYLLEGSKHYLAIADDHIGRAGGGGGGGGGGAGGGGGGGGSQMSFTPLSKTLAGTVHELHRTLLLALVSETNHIALTQILKCIASLVVNVPYYKLAEGLLSKVVRKVRQFVNHKEVGVKIASLTCLGSVLCVQNVIGEIRSVLMEKAAAATTTASSDAALLDGAGNGSAISATVFSAFPTADGDECVAETTTTFMDDSSSVSASALTLPAATTTTTASSTATTTGSSSVSWLAEHCFSIVNPEQRIGDGEPKVSPLRIEALQLLGYMVRSHIPVLQAGLHTLVAIIKAGLTDEESSVQLHSAKLLEELGRSLLTELEAASGGNSNNASSLRRVSLAEVKDIWISMLGDASLVAALQNMNEPLIQAAACDALATIGSQVFQMLPMDKVILSMTIPLGLAQSEIDPLVRASAIRALGIFIQYPTLREDVNFISDVGQAVISCLDPATSSASVGQQGVRIKAAWAFGNLSESLYVNRETLGASFVNELEDRLLLGLLISAISASYDTDKVRANAVRAVGNLLRYLPESRYQFDSFKETAAKAVYSLIANISSGLMKVRWNSCYALGNMLRNAPLLVSALGSVWLNDMFSALCAAVKDCKNFKVRINAALALSVPKERGFYGSSDQFVTVWQSLCLGLQNAEIVTDFSEVKYREVLTDQICMSLVHLMSLMTSEDLESPPLSSSLTLHFDSTLLPIFQQHGRRIAAVSTTDDRKNQASDKMMLMANAESHLGLLKTGLRVDDDGDAMEEEESEPMEAPESLRLVEQLLMLFSSSKEMEEQYAGDASFPTVNTAPNFKQTFD